MKKLNRKTKVLFILTIILAFASEAKSSTFTFHTAGSYDEEANWDVYPGKNITNGCTLLINANCHNIDLNIINGIMIFGENTINISVDNWTIGEEAQISFLSSSLTINTSLEGGIFDFTSNHIIETPSLDTVSLSLWSQDLNTHGLPFWDVPYMDFFFSGNQSSYLINNMVGKLTINGTVEVMEEEFIINCPTKSHLSSIFNSDQPIDIIIAENGSFFDAGQINFTHFNNVDNFIIEEGGSLTLKGYLFIN